MASKFMTNLRDLRIGGYDGRMEKWGVALSWALESLELLEVLSLSELGPGEIRLPSFSDHEYLYDLQIGGYIQKMTVLLVKETNY